MELASLQAHGVRATCKSSKVKLSLCLTKYDAMKTQFTATSRRRDLICKRI